jgi:hypothetical protein
VKNSCIGRALERIWYKAQIWGKYYSKIRHFGAGGKK